MQDYQQMVKEDILHGRINGEPLTVFLPQQLNKLLPLKYNLIDSEVMSLLKNLVGESRLSDILVEHFFILGKSGEEHAITSWNKLGLNPDKQTEIGIAIQSVLEIIDAQVEELDIESLCGVIKIDNNRVLFTTVTSYGADLLDSCEIAIAKPR
ncbi:MAG: hypothetical protein QM504_06870 [Pseudomonadota bacterium]